MNSGESRGPRILPAKRSTDFEAAVGAGLDVLKAGGLVAYPTESFYGLGVDITKPTAVDRVFEVKERAEEDPILILVHSIDAVGEYAREIPSAAREMMGAFWPGGLTLVFHADPKVNSRLTGGGGKIGIRISGNPLASSLCSALGRPITGTSANISGRGGCRSAEAVLASLDGRIDLILDGGFTPGGKGSTVLDVTTSPPRVLREGLISIRELSRYRL